jgi:hypothetical protein
LAQWKGSMIRRGDVMTSAGGEVTPMRGNGGDNDNWVEVNLIGPKNEENSRS